MKHLLLLKNPPLQKIILWSRLADPDTDTSGILELATSLLPSTVVELGDSCRLHAKVYIADNASAIFGSTNLTQAGFQDNLELLAHTDDVQEVKMAIEFLESIREAITAVSLSQLEHFVTQQLPFFPQKPASNTPDLVPIWDRGRSLQIEAEPQQCELPQCPDRPIQNDSGFLDPMILVRDARKILVLAQTELQGLDLEIMIGERLKLTLYPIGDTFALGMMQGQMPFSEITGTLLARYDVEEDSPRVEQLRSELTQMPFYLFRPLRKRKYVLVTPRFPTSSVIEQHFLLERPEVFYISYLALA